MESTYKYSIHSLIMKDSIAFQPGKINLFVGANNCGKTQLLKDMLSYITGETEETLILDELDVSYPDTWEDIENAYHINILDVNGSNQIKHISPTLDAGPSGSAGPSLMESVKSWLKNDKRLFRAMIGAGFITYLNTDNRLKMAMSQRVQQNLQERGPQNVLETLYISGTDSTEQVRQCTKRILGKDIFLSPFNLGTLEYRIGTDFSSVSPNPQKAFKQLSSYPLLDSQGDGMRSVIGIVSAIISVKKPIILLDEPEAFLHPPQALQLGEIISELVDSSQQIFIATHSADFLRGLLSSTRDAVITHLTRIGDVTKAKVLDSATLNQIVTDPLLSSSRVLEGMFYKGVMATEADAGKGFVTGKFT